MNTKRNGFTLIELLVVVAIIALLISIMLPSLSHARKQARAVACAANYHSAALAVHTYLSEYAGTYPTSYLYMGPTGTTSLADQANYKGEYGYVHWSYFLYNSGKVKEECFECPEFEHGGAPRTNPGPEGKHWEQGQADATGAQGSGNIMDKQAPRMSATANAAIMPRNKFDKVASGGPRTNRYVRDGEVQDSGGTILATEFLNEWIALGVQDGMDGKLLVKSHRPVNPFYHLSSGADEYKAPPQNDSFTYGNTSAGKYLGLLRYDELRGKPGVIEGSKGGSELNAVGRHHPGPKMPDGMGGAANFVFCDGHVERDHVYNTLVERRWGDKYFSLTGKTNIQKQYNK